MTSIRFPGLQGLLCVLALLFVATPDRALAEGGEHASSRWRLVNFWSEWCAPCRKEIPMLNALSEELAAHAIEVVGVNFDDSPRAETLQIAARLGIEFPILSRDELSTLRLRPPDVMPTTYILAPGDETVGSLIGLQTRDAIVARLRQLGALETL
ncbi:MAG: TlpA disulfide reductase family protein [Pseudomonadota bacterium]